MWFGFCLFPKSKKMSCHSFCMSFLFSVLSCGIYEKKNKKIHFRKAFLVARVSVCDCVHEALSRCLHHADVTPLAASPL